MEDAPLPAAIPMDRSMDMFTSMSEGVDADYAAVSGLLGMNRGGGVSEWCRGQEREGEILQCVTT
jgi:hypothetical protein